ncbi:hypothetical protein BaRGS_00023878 [Batillaria attramentaria]|uniref:Secreted protein n=1 Tax=Batillaria attramentaria TaxID=370345 RepID=A0ABD0KCX7_9CAEN
MINILVCMLLSVCVAGRSLVCLKNLVPTQETIDPRCLFTGLLLPELKPRGGAQHFESSEAYCARRLSNRQKVATAHDQRLNVLF